MTREFTGDSGKRPTSTPMPKADTVSYGAPAAYDPDTNVWYDPTERKRRVSNVARAVRHEDLHDAACEDDAGFLAVLNGRAATHTSSDAWLRGWLRGRKLRRELHDGGFHIVPTTATTINKDA